LGVLDQILARYGDQVRFVWRDFPVVTLKSPKAAEAGQCAHEQGQFWEFHDVIYEHDGEIEAADLRGYAVEIGLDMPQFDECVSSRRYRDKVNNEQREAFSLGFIGSPTFLVNDRLIAGPQRFEVFEKVIDSLLASPQSSTPPD
jgi:protein-disulfide isomerase